MLYDLGDMTMQRGDLERARALFEEALELRRAEGWDLGVAHALGGLGALANRTGDYARGRTIFEEIVAIAEANEEDGFRSLGLLGIATSALGAGDVEHAFAALRTCLALTWETEDLFLLPPVLDEVAIALDQAGRHEAAARVLAAADALHESSGTAAWEAERLDAVRSSLTHELGSERREHASGEGRAMTAEQAVAYAVEQLGEPATDEARTGAGRA